MRSFFFFLFWFLWIGSANVIPQAYFLTYAPAYKEVAIALLLMLGSLVSMVAILLGGRLSGLLYRYGQNPRVFVPVMLAVCLACFGALFLGMPPAIFFLCYLLFRFVSGMLYQFLDLAVVHGDDPDAALRHHRDAMLFMFLAITVSPLFFAYVDSAFDVSLTIVILGFASLYFLRNTQPNLRVGNASAMELGFAARVGSQWPFLLYVGAYLAVIYVTSSLLVYFIRDYYGLPHPIHKAGWVMFVICSCAAVSAMAYAQFRRHLSRDMNTLWVQAVIIGSQSIAILFLLLKLSDSLLYLCVCTSLMGGGYGMFMVLTRHYAGEIEMQEKNGLLALYNLLPYGSMMVAFPIVGGLKLLATYLGYDFYMLLAGLLALFMSLVMIVLPWQAASSRDDSNCAAVAATEKSNAD